MAAFAASLTWVGVGKSGSPAPKSTTWTPARFKRSASAATFIVAEPVTLVRRCASAIDIANLSNGLNLGFPAHPLLNGRRHEPANLAAEAEHFLNQTRAQIRVLLRRHHEHRLERRLQMPIHERHLELVLEIRYCAETANQRAGPPPAGVLDEQPVEGVHFDVRVLAEHLSNDLDALLGGKQRMFFGVDQHGDDDSLEQMRAAENDVDMTVRQRIERPWENRESPLRWPWHLILHL